MDRSLHKQYFDSEVFAEKFHCELPLGVFVAEGETSFRLWAPTAQSVELKLYEKGEGGSPVEEFKMIPGEKGTWYFSCNRSLEGYYYTYELVIDGQMILSQDPYGKACGINGQRSMILDLTKTDPEGWDRDKAPQNGSCQIVYELHIKDFSWDLRGGFSEQDRGRFSAFSRSGTTLKGKADFSTGLDYLKRLGVTHIQILPMYDYGSVDERCPECSYNWGYDPVNYNVPEGSYASDPYDGAVRIRELKEMIQALHAAGFRVIMDVVYNHTYNLESPLFKTVPWYFYRQNEDGTPANGSGCGNDIASERSMVSRYILDSVLHWTEEYHIDGFRFDLMGLLDRELMESIQRALDLRYGPGEKLVYGEPWSAGPTCERLGTILCHKGNLKGIDPSIGAFCDDTRDAVKGSVMDAESTGFVNGGMIPADKLAKCLTAWVGEHGSFQNPGQTITYLSCHDDWTLWDKLIYTMDPERNFYSTDERILRANKLAAAIYFSCQGRLFIHAGEEFGRTKGGIKNSYCSSAEVNRIDWERAWENRELVDYYRGLIALRKQLPGVTDLSSSAYERLLWVENEGEHCAVASIDNRGGHSPWDQLLLVYNCGDEPMEYETPECTWQVLVDGESAFRWQEEVQIGNRFTIPGQSAMILGLRSVSA